MSRIGRREIVIPDKVNVYLQGKKIVVEGPLGKLEQEIHHLVDVEIENGIIRVKRKSDTKSARSLHGLYGALILNMVKGVSEGFKKVLVIYGIGYKAVMEGKRLNLSVGYSHPTFIDPPEGIDIKVEDGRKIVVSGADKQMVGEVAAKIRKLHPPEPYIRKPEPRKGIFYEDERVRLKVGKSGA